MSDQQLAHGDAEVCAGERELRHRHGAFAEAAAAGASRTLPHPESDPPAHDTPWSALLNPAFLRDQAWHGWEVILDTRPISDAVAWLGLDRPLSGSQQPQQQQQLQDGARQGDRDQHKHDASKKQR